MSVDITYSAVGKGLKVDGDTLITYYGNDFNPTNPDLPSGWQDMKVSNATSLFDLDGFQPGHEVGCVVYRIENSGSSSESFTIYGDFERYGSSWSRTWRYGPRTGTLSANGGWYQGWIYFGVDDDEIWDGYHDYRIRLWGTAGGQAIEEFVYFSVDNLDIDSNLYPAGCFWVDGPHLCYTDGIYGDEGYMHKIAFDSSVYDYVGTDCAGSIWMENSGATAMQRLYYVTESGHKTRTYGCQLRYGGNVNVGSDKGGSIRVPTGDMEDGYGHLCYVTAVGQKLRVLNGPPSGVV